jgi:general stress protein YciG
MVIEIEKPRVRGRGKGFASMSPEERSRIAQMGGKAAQATGRAHKFTSEEAREAGRKGGAVSRQRSDRRFEQLV